MAATSGRPASNNSGVQNTHSGRFSSGVTGRWWLSVRERSWRRVKVKSLCGQHDSSWAWCRRNVGETDGLSNGFQCFSHDATVEDVTFSAVFKRFHYINHAGVVQLTLRILQFCRCVPILHTSVIKMSCRVSAEMWRTVSMVKSYRNKTCWLSHPTNDADQQTRFIQIDNVSMG